MIAADQYKKLIIPSDDMLKEKCYVKENASE